MRKLHLAIVPILAVLVAAYVLFPRATPRPGPQPHSPATGSASVEVEAEGRTGAPPDVAQNSQSTGTPEVAGSSPAKLATPRPSGGIGEPASYCKPGYCETPKPTALTVYAGGISGTATWWYSFGPGIYAAIRPDLGSKGDLAIVCGGQPFHCLTVPITTTCACLGPNSDRLIDLSRDAFASFADPSRGVVRITLQVVGR